MEIDNQVHDRPMRFRSARSHSPPASLRRHRKPRHLHLSVSNLESITRSKGPVQLAEPLRAHAALEDATKVSTVGPIRSRLSYDRNHAGTQASTRPRAASSPSERRPQHSLPQQSTRTVSGARASSRKSAAMFADSDYVSTANSDGYGGSLTRQRASSMKMLYSAPFPSLSLRRNSIAGIGPSSTSDPHLHKLISRPTPSKAAPVASSFPTVRKEPRVDAPARPERRSTDLRVVYSQAHVSYIRKRICPAHSCHAKLHLATSKTLTEVAKCERCTRTYWLPSSRDPLVRLFPRLYCVC